ncbi:hypothetical protein [Bradyrhizobium sp. 188]|uniref:hypothetical protein n=1 Tax=Bradyrhizobium sp. 188 TaxID=2782656 RepID=UPI001FFAE36B|nr:hypothetical protein [Bradyrhizobium sp. 188]MCK1498002.1 hypothetical protein [Bradyrhizobium sp. 188]
MFTDFFRFWMSSENLQTYAKNQFDKAKALSDFVGMIVRFGFANAAVAFFAGRAKETTGPESVVFGLCSVASFGLMAALGGGIAGIIFAYEMRAVSDDGKSHVLVRWFFVILAIGWTVALWFGITDLVHVLATTIGPKK